MLLRGGETLSLGGQVTLSVHPVPGHTAGSVAYVVHGQDDVFVGDAVQVHGAASRFPGYADPDAYRASLRHLLDDVRPRRLFLGHPYRTTAGEPYGLELDAAQGRDALRESLDVEARVREAAERYLRDGVREPTRSTRRSRRSPPTSATRATRGWNPPRSSPPCTRIAPGSKERAPMAEVSSFDAGGRRIAVRKDLRVPMRDGVELAVDAYHEPDDLPRPALIAMSAYGKELQALALTTPPQRRQPDVGRLHRGRRHHPGGAGGLRPRHR